MATTYTVSSTGDNINDQGSLRYAISQAQDGDTINFADSLSGQTIRITQTLTLAQGVTIDGGNDTTISSLSADGQTQSEGSIFSIVGGTSANPVTIKNLAINDARSTGDKGAFGSKGTAGQNTSQGVGEQGGPGGPGGLGGNTAGGIYVRSGYVVLTNDSFTNNQGTGGSGGLGGPGGQGGTGPDGQGPSGPKGAGGDGGNGAGAVYVEPGATVVLASNLTISNNAGVPGASGIGNPPGNQGNSYTVSNNQTVNDAVVCYVTGTLIRTVSGDVAVEALQVGNLVLTRDGRRKPIRWIGHRHVACARHPEPAKVHPVRVLAGSFGDGLPYADLWLSRNHALCLDNSLVPVRGLIDGDRIAQMPVEAVTYWHVELDGHDVILANGLPAESYLDTGNRRGFENAAEVTGVGATTLHFDEAPAPGYDGSGYCLPMIESGPRLSAIRARYGLGRTAAAAPAQAACAVHLVADEVVIAPCLSGENELRFLVPAGASELRLVSPAFPAGGADIRRLGVIVDGLAVSDGAAWRDVPLNDAGLYAGFHTIEREAGKAWRWTDGEAHLSPSLWAELSGPVLLRFTGVFAGLSPVEIAEEETRAAA